MVVIRLARQGAKKRPFYHVVAADKRSACNGRFVEKLGFFDPIAQGKAVRLNLDLERLDYWMSVGAQPSDRVKTLLKEFKKTQAGEETAKSKKVKKLEQKKKVAKKAKVEATKEVETAKEAEETKVEETKIEETKVEATVTEEKPAE